MKSDDKVRLNAYIASSTSLSRRASDKAIEEGRVSVNGVPATLGLRVGVDDVVTLDGKTIEPYEKHSTYVLNKPKGYICSSKDPHMTHYAQSLIKVEEQFLLHSIGRLDMDSEGLILFTTDGSLTEKITHPRNGIEKEYYVKTTQKISPQDAKTMERGIQDNGELLKAKKVSIMGPKEALVVLSEGKNREIRRMFDHLKNPVTQLVRIRIGSYCLPNNLPLGAFKKLSDSDIKKIFKNPNNE